MTSYLPDISNQDLVSEFDKLQADIGVMSRLADLIVHKWIGDRAESDHVILQITKSGELKLHQFDLELEASRALLDLEKAHPDDNIVLVGAKTIEEVVSAFRNYFNDVTDFLILMKNAHRMLGGALATNEQAAQ